MKLRCQLFLAANSRYLDRYDFETLPKEKDVVYVAILNDKSAYTFFDRYYTCPAKRQHREPTLRFELGTTYVQSSTRFLKNPVVWAKCT